MWIHQSCGCSSRLGQSKDEQTWPSLEAEAHSMKPRQSLDYCRTPFQTPCLYKLSMVRVGAHRPCPPRQGVYPTSLCLRYSEPPPDVVRHLAAICPGLWLAAMPGMASPGADFEVGIELHALRRAHFAKRPAHQMRAALQVEAAAVAAGALSVGLAEVAARQVDETNHMVWTVAAALEVAAAEVWVAGVAAFAMEL